MEKSQLYKHVCLPCCIHCEQILHPFAQMSYGIQMSSTQYQPCGQFQEGISIWKVFKNTTLKLTDFKEPKHMLEVKQDYTEQGQISQCVQMSSGVQGTQ